MMKTWRKRMGVRFMVGKLTIDNCKLTIANCKMPAKPFRQLAIDNCQLSIFNLLPPAVARVPEVERAVAAVRLAGARGRQLALRVAVLPARERRPAVEAEHQRPEPQIKATEHGPFP